jgi:hypothetical protein
MRINLAVLTRTDNSGKEEARYAGPDSVGAKGRINGPEGTRAKAGL